MRSKIYLLTLCIVSLFSEVNANENDFEVIEVTAQKRSRPIQDVPISMQAFDGEALENFGADDVKSILSLLSNVSSNASSDLNSGITIRGVGTNNFHANVNQAVGVYMDEVSMSSPFSGAIGLFDVHAVEVLRGPQNSLFGRNTTGGAINYTSNKPLLDEWSGRVKIGLGNANSQELLTVLNAPIGKDMALRFAHQSQRQDGLFKNLATDNNAQPLGKTNLGDKKRDSSRLQFKWELQSNSELLVNWQSAKTDGSKMGYKAMGTRSVDDPYLFINGKQDYIDASEIDDRALISPLLTNVNFDSSSRLNTVDRNGFNPATGNKHQAYNVSSGTALVEVEGSFIKAQHDFDSGMQFLSITSANNIKVNNAEELSGTNSLQFIAYQDGRYQQISQEFRLLSNDDAEFNWLVGLYLYQEDMELYTIVRRFNYIGPSGNIPREIMPFNYLDQTDKDISIYGQTSWALSNKLNATVGLRYSKNDKTAESTFGVAANYNTPPSNNTNWSNIHFNTATDLIFDNVPLDQFISGEFIESCREREAGGCFIVPSTQSLYELEQSLSEISGNVILDYQLKPNTLIYTSYSRGFKSGGFDTRALASLFGDGAEQAFKPEFLDAYELGIKTNITSNFQLSAASFFYQWHDLQTFGVFEGQPQYVNIPLSEIVGLELETKWLPAPSLDVQTSLGLLQSEVVDVGGLTAADETHQLTNTPETTFNLSVNKAIEFGSSFVLFHLDSRYVSKQLDSLTFDRDFYSEKSEQFWLNASVGYYFGTEQQYKLGLQLNNITKESHCIDMGGIDFFAPNTSADSSSTGIDLASTVTCLPSETSGQQMIGASFDYHF
jgi:iron complex outermembrane receptor protein